MSKIISAYILKVTDATSQHYSKLDIIHKYFIWCVCVYVNDGDYDYDKAKVVRVHNYSDSTSHRCAGSEGNRTEVSDLRPSHVTPWERSPGTHYIGVWVGHTTECGG